MPNQTWYAFMEPRDTNGKPLRWPSARAAVAWMAVTFSIAALLFGLVPWLALTHGAGLAGVGFLVFLAPCVGPLAISALIACIRATAGLVELLTERRHSHQRAQ